MARNVEENQAAALIEEHRIHKIDQTHPACVVFMLGNGKRLTLWDASYEHDRGWEYDR